MEIFKDNVPLEVYDYMNGFFMIEIKNSKHFQN